MSSVAWQVAPFDALEGREVYALLQLRQRVFVVEQRCAFLDADGIDPGCLHVLGWRGGDLVATARVVPAGRAHAEVSIGRVATRARGEGIGRALMIESMNAAYTAHGDVPLYLWAQAYLERFYRSLGFEVSGPEGEEDGIPHLPMLRARR